MKRKVFHFINENKIFIDSIYLLIVLNVISIILESYKGLREIFSFEFYAFEAFSVVIFSIEYVLRVWTSNLDESISGKGRRLKFVISGMGIIDLLSILPFYLPFLLPFDLRMLRILRLFRLLRIIKLGRLSRSLKTISSVLKESKSDLAITIFSAFVLLILSSTIMYYVENEAQPDKFDNIGQSLWWAVATLTTVGYGDIYPITGLGKFMSAIIALIGIGFIALPTGIISSAFIEKVQKDKKQKIEDKGKCKCPKCGTEFDKID
jgi:voltage-gated potassium channel